MQNPGKRVQIQSGTDCSEHTSRICAMSDRTARTRKSALSTKGTGKALVSIRFKGGSGTLADHAGVPFLLKPA